MATSKDKEEALNAAIVREQLLKTVKAEVKRLMEEAVTKKFIHEGSSTVTAFCAAVEACLQYGLKKRTVTLFGGSNTLSTLALLERVARSFEPAARIVKTARETESSIAAAHQRQYSNGSVDGSSRSADSATLPRIFNWQSFTALSRTASDSPPAHDANMNGSRVSLSRQTSTPPNTPPSSPQLRFVWIRLALSEHVLDQIVQHIAKNALKYYERNSVMADACASALLGSLLVGPCTLDFTKLKTCDHFLTDPPAEELIQRHRIHSNSLFHSGSLVAQSRFGAAPHSRATSSCGSSKRPSLHIRKKPRNASSSSSGEDFFSPFGGSLNLSSAAISGAAKDYIEALHQNSRTTLLYGKNNVRVQLKLLEKPLSGYLQIHQTGENMLLLKWTPNELMNAGVNENGKMDEPAELAALVESLMNEPDCQATASLEAEAANSDTASTPTPLSGVITQEEDAAIDMDDAASAASQRSLMERSICASDSRGSSSSHCTLTPPRTDAQSQLFDCGVSTDSALDTTNSSSSSPEQARSAAPVWSPLAQPIDHTLAKPHVHEPVQFMGRIPRRLQMRHEKPGLLKEIAQYGRRCLFWKYALTITFDDVVYIHCHCHQQPEDHDTVILVGKDGAQYPPFHFPKGGHLLQFLSCVDNGLQHAGGYIDPPLSCDENGVESFPRLRRRSSLLRNDTPSDASAASEVRDYVFRIVHSHIVYQYSDDEDSSALTFTAARASNGVVGESACTPSSTGIATMTTASVSVSPISTVTSNSVAVANGNAHAHAHAEAEANGNTNRVVSPTSDVDASANANANASANGSTIADDLAADLQASDTTAALVPPDSPHDLIRQLCETMRGQLLSRAFYGWLEYTRYIKTVRKHLAELVNATIVPNDSPCDARRGLTSDVWRRMRPPNPSGKNDVLQVSLDEVRRFVYYGGCTHEVRRQVWPYLLGHYRPDSTAEDRVAHDKQARIDYEQTVGEWLAIEAIVQQREKEHLEAFLSKKSGLANAAAETVSLDNDVFDRQNAAGGSSYTSPLHHRGSLSSSPTGSIFSLNNNEDSENNASANAKPQSQPPAQTLTLTQTPTPTPTPTPTQTLMLQSMFINTPQAGGEAETETPSLLSNTSVIVQVSAEVAATATPASPVDTKAAVETTREKDLLSVHGETDRASESQGVISNSKESLVSPGSPASNGDVYRRALIDDFGMNLHRIDKDVQRCDRNHPYFADLKNLEKLRHIMCTYVWTHLEMGYAQGMCDLVAPLLVVLDDEALTYSCYCHLMERMVTHFPRETSPQAALDGRFASMRSLVQILDAELFELMQRNGDYTHFFFAYRWFLLDFKRELAYEDVFAVWECIWSAPAVSTSHFVLFVALALVQFYREIIIDNNMDFTDIIRFFNEMAEKHDGRQLLWIARHLVYQLQSLIQSC